MKLHLPVSLRKSVFACILATAGIFPSLSISAASWGMAACLLGTPSAKAETSTVTITSSGKSELISTPFAGHIDLQQDTLSVGSPVVISSGRELSLGMTGAVLDSDLFLGDGRLSIDYSGSGAATSLNNFSLTLLGGTQLQLSSLGNGDGKTYELFSGIGSLLGHDGSVLSLNSANNAISNYFDTTRPGSGFWKEATLQLVDGSLQLVLHEGEVITSADPDGVTRITTRQSMGANYQYYAGVRFENIAYDSSSQAEGGAIYGDSYSTITLSDNGSVTFSGNTAKVTSSANYRTYACGGAICRNSYSTITLSNNGSVTFSGNTATSSAYDSAYGGAISGGDITLSDNGSVTFYGGTITLSDNGSVTFSGNTASSKNYAYGGAISGGIITLSGNGSVTFSGNSVSGYYVLGGAIYGDSSSTITLSNNGSVTFSGNKAKGTTSGDGRTGASGGAIYGDRITLSGNGSVTFDGNTASGEADAPGGAICGNSYSTITLSNNGSVTFSGNTAFSGGAIYGYSWSTITLSNNGSVTFDGNTATSSNAYGYGGAISGFDCTITLSNNGSVTFSGNSVSSAVTASGGAIYGSRITLSDNGSVTFSGNTATSSNAYGYGNAYGGAIDGASSSTITLSDNGSVTFSGNTASGSSNAYGGAIYSSGNLNIRNNDSVEFYQNAEVSDGSYRLRSIYAGGSKKIISLSAGEGKNITFRDSVYIASGNTLNLNETYRDREQKGDIIFTGATTVNDLYMVKGNVDGTEEEIQASRTSEVHSAVHLYGGRLRVEEQAVLKTTAGLTVAADSNATVKIDHAELDAGTSDIAIGATGTLELSNGAIVRAHEIIIDDEATLAMSCTDLQTRATFTLSEAVAAGTTAYNTGNTVVIDGDLTLNGGATLVADNAYCRMTEGSVLTFNASDEKKINLILTLGMVYEPDVPITLFTGVESMRFIYNGELTDSAAVNPGDFFTGAWINESTTFTYDAEAGAFWVMNVNSLSIPEPTTTTLGLLALAGLAARRRRLA